MTFQNQFILLCLFAVASCNTCRPSSEVGQLEAYIEAKRPNINPRFRPHYHVSPPVGWMNDPNGFSYYKGKFHIFYQFYPYDSVWGPMHWGHSSSPDLVSWETLPTALIPSKELCFSGSAVVEKGRLILIYTGRVNTHNETKFNESQYLAFSYNGLEFEKYQGNPVLTADPNGAADFRDPKVWRHGQHWYMVLGSKTDDSRRGRILLYRSPDLYHWEFISVLVESGVTGDFGYMAECPDMFKLNGRYVITWSAQGMDCKGDRFKNIYPVGYLIGIFNYKTFIFEPTTCFQELDYGHDFYASQTMYRNGKRYLVAWCNTWEKEHPEAVDGWAGMLTMFRELKLVGDRILMKPVPEITTLRDGVVIKGDLCPNHAIEFAKTGEIFIRACLKEKIDILIVGRYGGNKVWLRWDPAVEKVAVDRDGDVRQVEWKPIRSHEWRLFLDASSMELFCGEGEVVFSSRAYPHGDWIFTNLGPQTLNIEAYKLKRSVSC